MGKAAAARNATRAVVGLTISQESRLVFPLCWGCFWCRGSFNWRGRAAGWRDRGKFREDVENVPRRAIEAADRDDESISSGSVDD